MKAFFQAIGRFFSKLFGGGSDTIDMPITDDPLDQTPTEEGPKDNQEESDSPKETSPEAPSGKAEEPSPSDGSDKTEEPSDTEKDSGDTPGDDSSSDTPISKDEPIVDTPPEDSVEPADSDKPLDTDSPPEVDADTPLPPAQPSGLKVILEREPDSGEAVLGKLSIDDKIVCHTLESASNMLASGTYQLTLREKGGLHATYAYKYGDIHKGILQILNGSEEDFVFIRTGNKLEDTDGGIIVGESVQSSEAGHELWNSDKAYQAFYPGIADKLSHNQGVDIIIK